MKVLVVAATVSILCLLPAAVLASHTSGILFAESAISAGQADGAPEAGMLDGPGSAYRTTTPTEDTSVRIDRAPEDTPPVPEPATLLLLTGGLLAMAVSRRKR